MKSTSRYAARAAVLATALLAVRVAAAQEDDLEVPAAPAHRQTLPADASAPPPSSPTHPAAPAANEREAATADASAADATPDLEARVRALEARLAAEDAGAPPGPQENSPVRASREPTNNASGVVGPLGLVLSGYVQAQFQASQISEDQVQQGGLPINDDRFLVRRARLRVDRAWKWADTAIEIDGNTTRGASFGLRRAEASLVWRNEQESTAPPWVRFTAGLSEIPFGHELVESSRSRFFMERSAGSLALFPGEPDVGARLSGGASFFRYAISVLNGEPFDDRPGRSIRDPNAAKDIVARVGVDTRPAEKLRASGGVSFLTGRGFHAGKDATKNAVMWRDLNENGQIDGGEITAVPGTAATPSENFPRWAFGVDAQLGLDTVLGRSRLYGEVFIAQNADRGLFVSDPIATGTDARQLGFYVAYVQDLTRFFVVGLRADYYDPNADVFDSRGGKLIPADSSVLTLSPLAGVVLPDRVRVLLQYDFIRDRLARDAAGVPADLRNDQLTIRLQGEL